MAFPEAVGQMRDDIQQAYQRLSQAKVDKLTQDVRVGRYRLARRDDQGPEEGDEGLGAAAAATPAEAQFRLGRAGRSRRWLTPWPS